MKRWMVCLGWVCVSALLQAQQVYQPQAPVFNETQRQQRLQNNPWRDVGSVSFGNMRVPAHAISVRHPIESGWLTDDVDCLGQTCQVKVSAKVSTDTALWQQLKALYVAGIGWVLVPKTWQDIEADVGVNSSQALLATSPDGKESIAFYHSGACVGCALVSASPWFEQAHRAAKAYDFPAYRARSDVHVVRAQADKVLFSYQLPHQYKTHAVAYWRDENDEPYRELRVTLHPSKQALAGLILNVGVRAD